MGDLVIYFEKKVKAKGVNKNYSINSEKFEEYFFSGDKEKLDLVNFTLDLKVKEPIFFYPGCGVDVLYLLFFLRKVFPTLQKVKLIFNDLDPNLGIIKTILDEIGVCFSEGPGKISFYWEDCLLELEFLRGNVFQMKLPNYDIYFERAFRIMKEKDLQYEQKIYDHLNPDGIIISDSGFQTFYLERTTVPLNLSSYGEMIVGRKK